MLPAPADGLALPLPEDLVPAVSLATALREQGIRVQLYTENKKFKAKMNYADKLKVPFVAFLGEDEVKNGVVSLKDMASGVQESVALTAAPGWLAEKVAGLGVGTPIRDRE